MNSIVILLSFCLTFASLRADEQGDVASIVVEPKIKEARDENFQFDVQHGDAGVEVNEPDDDIELYKPNKQKPGAGGKPAGGKPQNKPQIKPVNNNWYPGWQPAPSQLQEEQGGWKPVDWQSPSHSDWSSPQQSKPEWSAPSKPEWSAPSQPEWSAPSKPEWGGQWSGKPQQVANPQPDPSWIPYKPEAEIPLYIAYDPGANWGPDPQPGWKPGPLIWEPYTNWGPPPYPEPRPPMTVQLLPYPLKPSKPVWEPEPEWSAPSKPQWSAPSKPEWSPPSKPVWEPEPEWSAPSKPQWSAPSKPEWSPPSKPGWEPQPEWSPPSKPQWSQPSKPESEWGGQWGKPQQIANPQPDPSWIPLKPKADIPLYIAYDPGANWGPDPQPAWKPGPLIWEPYTNWGPPPYPEPKPPMTVQLLPYPNVKPEMWGQEAEWKPEAEYKPRPTLKPVPEWSMPKPEWQKPHVSYPEWEAKPEWRPEPEGVQPGHWVNVQAEMPPFAESAIPGPLPPKPESEHNHWSPPYLPPQNAPHKLKDTPSNKQEHVEAVVVTAAP